MASDPPGEGTAIDPAAGDDRTAIDASSPLERFSQESLGTAPTSPLPEDASHEPASLARIAAGTHRPPREVPLRAATPPLSLTSAADAMRNEEIERTRLFMIMGWVISVVAIGTVPFVTAPRVTSIMFIGGLIIGIAVSAVLYRRLADPANYSERILLGLALMCAVNGHIAVL